MEYICVQERSLPEAYHRALLQLQYFGDLQDCPDWNTKALEMSLVCTITKPLAEPRISRLFIGGPDDLQQYTMEMLDGILDFEVGKGNWDYTYHQRMVNPECDQVLFVINELSKNPYSRRAVIDIRDKHKDMYSNDPACLQNIQYQIRNGKLDCTVLFRSNDACKAFYMNAFALIMLQKRMADDLEVEIGSYTHIANNFHCYEKDIPMLEGYCERIYRKGLYSDDLVYRYEGDWKDIMQDAIPDILKKVEVLKNERS